MKALVTGHKRGVGKWISSYLKEKDFEIQGFSQSEEKDINDPHVQDELVLACESANIFVNNAHSGFAQVELLQKVFKKWKNSEKLILNIGAGHFRPEIWQLVDSQYTAEKAALHALTQTIQAEQSQCRVSLLALGMMDTESCSPLPPPKISQEQLNHCLDFILSAPRGLNIESLMIAPVQLS